MRGHGNRPHPTSLCSATFPRGEGFTSRCCPRWKRHYRASCIAAASSGETYEAGNRPHPTSLCSATFPKGKAPRPAAARVGNGTIAQAASQRPHPLRHAGTGNRPHPTSLFSATFPRGEGFTSRCCPRWKRQVRATSKGTAPPLAQRPCRHSYPGACMAFFLFTDTSAAAVWPPPPPAPP